MNKNKKTFFLIGGIVAFVAVAGFLIYGIQKGKDKVVDKQVEPKKELSTMLVADDANVKGQNEALDKISGKLDRS